MAFRHTSAVHAAVAFGSSTTAVEIDKDVDSLSIALPSGTTQGDFLLATIASKKDARSITAPSGWTLIDEGANP